VFNFTHSRLHLGCIPMWMILNVLQSETQFRRAPPPQCFGYPFR
jgi:hypothetical protein